MYIIFRLFVEKIYIENIIVIPIFVEKRRVLKHNKKSFPSSFQFIFLIIYHIPLNRINIYILNLFTKKTKIFTIVHEGCRTPSGFRSFPDSIHFKAGRPFLFPLFIYSPLFHSGVQKRSRPIGLTRKTTKAGRNTRKTSNSSSTVSDDGLKQSTLSFNKFSYQKKRKPITATTTTTTRTSTSAIDHANEEVICIG